jgi:pilus assembly protein CpaE
MAPGEPLRVLLISLVEEQRYEIVRALQGGNSRLFWVSQPDLAATRARDLLPHVVLIDDELGGTEPAALVRELVEALPEATVVALVRPESLDLARDAVLAGARGFVGKPVQPDDFMATLRTVLARPARQTQDSAGPVGRLVVCFAPKGGTGRTTLSINVAVALRSAAGGNVALVDADYSAPALDVALDLREQRDITDLLPKMNALDADMINTVLARHASGVRVLLAPPPESLSAPISRPQAQQVCASLRRMFSWVVVDLGLPMDEAAYAFLEAADCALISVLPEMTCMRNAKLALDHLDKRDYPAEKVWLVLNRDGLAGAMSSTDVETWLDRPVQARIPDDESLASEARARGVPFVMTHRRSKLGQSYISLARMLAAQVKVGGQATSEAPAPMPALLPPALPPVEPAPRAKKAPAAAPAAVARRDAASEANAALAAAQAALLAAGKAAATGSEDEALRGLSDAEELMRAAAAAVARAESEATTPQASTGVAATAPPGTQAGHADRHGHATSHTHGAGARRAATAVVVASGVRSASGGGAAPGGMGPDGVWISEDATPGSWEATPPPPPPPAAVSTPAAPPGGVPPPGGYGRSGLSLPGDRRGRLVRAALLGAGVLVVLLFALVLGRRVLAPGSAESGAASTGEPAVAVAAGDPSPSVTATPAPATIASDTPSPAPPPPTLPPTPTATDGARETETATRRPSITPRPTITGTRIPTWTTEPTNTPGPSPTPIPSETPIPPPSPTPTDTATAEPTATPAETATPTATATTRPAPRPTATRRPAATRPAGPPALVSPADGEARSGEVAFSWTPGRTLAKGQAWEVVIWPPGTDANAARGIAPPTTGNQLLANLDGMAKSGLFPGDSFVWTVIPVQLQPYKRLAAPAGGRLLRYTGPR